MERDPPSPRRQGSPKAVQRCTTKQIGLTKVVWQVPGCIRKAWDPGSGIEQGCPVV